MTRLSKQNERAELARKQARELMQELGATQLSAVKAPDGGELLFYGVNFGPNAGGVVIVQLFAGGHGWTHYMESRTGKLEQLEAEIRAHFARPHD